MKNFYILIPIPIYRISVIVFFEVGMETIIKTGIKNGIEKKRFTKDWKKWLQDEIEENKAQGVTLDYGEDNKDVLIWIKEKPKKLSQYAVLYHELYHAVDHIADSRNFSQDDKISEPRSYLFEYLFMETSKILWNKKM